MPNRYAIHVSAPRVHNDNDSLLNLAKAIHNTLELAENKGIAVIALPAIANGIYGFDFNDAVKIYANEASPFKNSKVLDEIRFVFTKLAQVELMKKHLLAI